MRCKKIRGKKYCFVNGKWVETDKKNYNIHIKSDAPMKINKSVKTRKGVC